METGPDVMRRYRKQRAVMSQDRLAKLAGVTTGAISQIERGVDRPRRETAQRIDDALEAGGEVLMAFGYSVNGSTDYVTRSEFDQLRERIRGVATVVDRMERALREAGVLGHTPPHGQDRPSA